MLSFVRLSPLVFGLLLFFATSGRAADNPKLVRLQQSWTYLLRHHVTTDGRLDYESLLDEEEQLWTYLQSLRKLQPATEGWTPDETKSFWINTYNAAAANLILENYPLTSINDIRIKTMNGYESPWETAVVNVGGENYSLNQIEKQILYVKFHDPRIHFALMYGAASGAPMLAEAYDGALLNQQLDQQTRRFINDSSFNQLSPQQVKLSALFQSYAAEFGSGSDLLNFVNRYANSPVLPTATIDYLSFNWGLNNRTALSGSQALGHK